MNIRKAAKKQKDILLGNKDLKEELRCTCSAMINHNNHLKMATTTLILLSCCILLPMVAEVEGIGQFSNELWSFTGKQPKQNTQVRITLALKQTNIQWLEETLNRVSDPQSRDYGKYMSIPEIVQHVHGDSEGVEKVIEVLYSAGLTPQFTIGEGFAVVDASVQTIEELFNAKYHEFRHKVHTELLVLRSLHSTIPDSLVDYVDFVSGIHDFPSTIHRAKKHHDIFAATNESVFGDTTPKTIDKAYNISGFTASNETNSQAIAGFLGQFFSPDDLKSFQKQYSIPSNPISRVIGTNKPASPGMEASLDVQYITSTGRNVSTWFISVEKEANGKQEDFMTWLLQLVNNTDSPWVHSVSYGDYENSIDPAYMSRTEQEFMKLGISGRSLLFASGDDGTSCSVTKGGKFDPMWPASSPHVTTVGGTESMTECWDHSGGGFSNLFTTPAYQKDAVENYLQTANSLPSSKYFNSTGRGYPDLSVFSINYDITILGIPWPVDGTSCAAPTTAGIISLLNDIRLNKGQSTLGFLNPLLYKLQGEGFTDVTQGDNRGKAWCKGFQAGKGWDPASGWGSPNFGLLKILINN